jgi:hypothetical protein
MKLWKVLDQRNLNMRLLWNCSTWQIECQVKRKKVYAPISKVLSIQPYLNVQVLEMVRAHAS